MPFRLAVLDEAEGVHDGTRSGWMSVFGTLGVEGGGDAAFDDAGVGAILGWGQAEAGDLGEEVGQEAVDTTGEASGEARARWQRGMARRSRWRVPVTLRRSGSRAARSAASAIRQRMAR
jgi:hypothetical protein